MADLTRKTANLLNSNQSTQGDGYVDNALLKDGNVIQNTNAFFVTEYMPVTEGTYYYYNNLFRTTVGYINYYNSNKIHLGNVQQKSVMAQGTYNLTALTIPSGVSYIRMSIDKQSTENGLYTSQLPAYEPYGWVHALRKLTTATETIENPLYSDGTAITSYTIKGNTVQSGTPTPSNPITISGVGNKTANLFPISSFTGKSYTVMNNFNSVSETIEFLPNTQYTISLDFSSTLQTGIFKITFVYTDETSSSSDWLYGTTHRTFTSNAGKTVSSISLTDYAQYVDVAISDIMLNTGSTALPYEPYGYKIPISSGGVTTNLYTTQPLMKVGDSADSKSATTETRAIYKYEFNGNELWSEGTNIVFISLNNLQNIPVPIGASTLFCSHFPNDNTGIINGNSWFFQVFGYTAVASDVTTWKQYLADQYAAGTPVTVWYQLATQTTESVTAPSIPTTEGENSITVDTTVQPSEFTATWTGWHDSAVKEWDGSDWQ